MKKSRILLGSILALGMFASLLVGVYRASAPSNVLAQVRPGVGLWKLVGTVLEPVNSSWTVSGVASLTPPANPDVIQQLFATTKYYYASSTATDNLAWRFNNGFVSAASSTISSTLDLAGILTSKTTGTSTFAGGISMNRAAGQSVLSIIPTGDLGSASAPTQHGTLVIDTTLNTATPGFYLSSSQAGVPSNPMAIIRSEDNAYNQGLLWLLGTSGNSGGAAYGVKIQDANPDIEFRESDKTSPIGEYEIDVNNDLLRMNGRNTANDSFDTIAWFSRNDVGGTGQSGEFCLGCGFSYTAGGRIQVVGTSTPSIPYLNLGTAAGTGNVLTVLKNGLTGLATTSPYKRLSVGGDIVSDSIYATSTTATSTFDGSVTMNGSVGGPNLLRLNCNKNYFTATETPTDGCLNITGTSNNSASLLVYTNAGSSANSPVVLFRADNTAFDDGLLRLIMDGTNGGAYNIRMDGPAPQIEMVESDQVAPNGKWEIGGNGDIFYISSRNAADNSFEGNALFSLYQLNDGGLHGIGSSTPWGKLSVNATTSMPATAPHFVVADSSMATELIVSSAGNTGVGTTSPWRKFSVVGTIGLDTSLTNAAGTPGSICYNTTTFEMSKYNALTCTVSDEEQKTELLPLGFSALELIDKIQPSKFFMEDNITRLRYGFGAQSLQEIDPRLADAYDDKNIARSIDIPALLAVNTQGIKELNDKIKLFNGETQIEFSRIEDNWQWGVIGLLLLMAVVQQVRISKLAKKIHA